MSNRFVVRGRWTLAVLVAPAVFTGTVHAQGDLPPALGTPGVAGEVRTVNGRVMRGSGDAAEPVPGQVVVLHRIAADSAGPVDSVRTSSSGAYRFRYTLDGPRSMYIVSARYAGVAYFSAPLREKDVSGPAAEVAVYDTTSTQFPLTIRARHVVIAPPQAGGLRQVVDVYEVSNDSARTLVPGSSGTSWRLTLPGGATNPASTGGDLPGDSFRFVDGVAELQVPFAPGSRQLVLTYFLPVESRVSMEVREPVSALEVLLEGTGSEITGAGLVAEEPVSMEGRTFQRYRAANVSPGSSFAIQTAGAPGRGRLALLVVAGLAIALGIVLGRRATPQVIAAGTTATRPESLAREIAALDHVYAAEGPRAGGGLRYYQERRAALLGQLVEAQAVEDRDSAT